MAEQDKKSTDNPGAKKSAGVMDPFEQPARRVVRFTMARDLQRLDQDVPLPFGYRLESWCDPMMPAYAATMAVAFSDSPDLDVYPRLASREGCGNIMQELVSLEGFITGASWLAFFNREPCALILTWLTEEKGGASIRIVGVAPRHRRIRIGSQLVNKALWALHDRKLRKVTVKVSRANRAGVLFFRSMKFHIESSREYL